MKVWHLLVLICCVFLGIGGCCAVAGKGIPYSDGYRDGHIQKLSHKGILFKSWEGQLALPGLQAAADNTVSNVFDFTVDQKELVTEMQSLNATDYVRIHYDQRLFGSPLVSESSYFVTKIEKLEKH